MDKKLQLQLLRAALSQVNSEIESDNSTISLFLNDPTLIPVEGEDAEHNNPAYKLHQLFHHLATNTTARELILNKINEYVTEEDVDF